MRNVQKLCQNRQNNHSEKALKQIIDEERIANSPNGYFEFLYNYAKEGHASNAIYQSCIILLRKLYMTRDLKVNCTADIETLLGVLLTNRTLNASQYISCKSQKLLKNVAFSQKTQRVRLSYGIKTRNNVQCA